ncbi:hypothetical protein QR680_007926 [Steinernema hermaphroditum]|uniref:non-specific serine/threonine protein kinase n=1 Tax=Steinernema hermaphroditum TaxID=289476 RepID=A0AA39M639_9BILA|nr:hypothetical protein QR680_007926 [Steinernema hermaphroditum]
MEQESAKEYGRGGLPYIEPGECLAKEFYVIRKLGCGNFSVVWLCWHATKLRFYAVKIVKSLWKYRVMAKDEIKILQRTVNVKEIVEYAGSFMLRRNGEHVCIVTEVLGENMLYAIDNIPNERRVRVVKLVTRCLLRGLAALEKRHVVHTDIKPENLLFTKPELVTCFEALDIIEKMLKRRWLPKDALSAVATSRIVRMTMQKTRDLQRCKAQIEKRKDHLEQSTNTEVVGIKIADLGNAVIQDYRLRGVIQTMQYRSPESVLRLGFDYTTDVFSAACTIFEWATGDYLFDVPNKTSPLDESKDLLTRLTLVVGDLPHEVLRHGLSYRELFDEEGHLKRPAGFSGVDEPPKALYDILVEVHGWDPKAAQGFARFLLMMLRLDPTKRPTAKECLQHQWLS